MDKFPPLNLPIAPLELKKQEGQVWVKDKIRKKELVLTPEEWVRQHCVHYLISELNYSPTSIALEGKLEINGLTRRYDILVYKNGVPQILVECKAASIPINQKVFDQIARYNLTLNVPFLWLTNGISHCFATINYSEEKYQFIKALPKYE